MGMQWIKFVETPDDRIYKDLWRFSKIWILKLNLKIVISTLNLSVECILGQAEL